MKTNLMFATLLTAGMAMAQVIVPDGAKIRVRLEENLSSETAELGQTVDFAVTQEVHVGDAIVIANGARATGSIVKVEPRRRIGRAGQIDFTIERVMLVDGNWLNVRYTPQKNHGKGNGVATGVLTAGLAVVFWPAAPIGLLIKGHEATVIKGRTYEVFSDDSVLVANAIPASSPQMGRMLPQAPATMLRQSNGAPYSNAGLPNTMAAPVNPSLVSNVSLTTGGDVQPTAQAAPAASSAATVAISSNLSGADIEIDGAFVGNAPTTVQLAAGMHKISVKQGSSTWERDLQVTAGNVTINATLAHGPVQRAASR